MSKKSCKRKNIEIANTNDNESVDAFSTNENSNDNDDGDDSSLRNNSMVHIKSKTTNEQMMRRKESNRISAKRSRDKQKVLVSSLQEKICNIKSVKAYLEKRGTNAIKEILKRWPLPTQIPDEFSSIEPLLHLIQQVSLIRIFFSHYCSNLIALFSTSRKNHYRQI